MLLAQHIEFYTVANMLSMKVEGIRHIPEEGSILAATTDYPSMIDKYVDDKTPIGKDVV